MRFFHFSVILPTVRSSFHLSSLQRINSPLSFTSLLAFSFIIILFMIVRLHGLMFERNTIPFRFVATQATISHCSTLANISTHTFAFVRVAMIISGIEMCVCFSSWRVCKFLLLLSTTTTTMSWILWAMYFMRRCTLLFICMSICYGTLSIEVPNANSNQQLPSLVVFYLVSVCLSFSLSLSL